MKNAFRYFVAITAALWLGGAATCHFGVEYEIAKIPRDVRARMQDTDWVGVDWVFRGIALQGIGVLVLLGGLAVRAYVRDRQKT